eukprot:5070120-Prymnesium_polylepis.1
MKPAIALACCSSSSRACGSKWSTTDGQITGCGPRRSSCRSKLTTVAPDAAGAWLGLDLKLVRKLVKPRRRQRYTAQPIGKTTSTIAARDADDASSAVSACLKAFVLLTALSGKSDGGTVGGDCAGVVGGVVGGGLAGGGSQGGDNGDEGEGGADGGGDGRGGEGGGGMGC